MRILDKLRIGHVLIVQVVGLRAPLEEELSPLLHAERSSERYLLNDIPGCLWVIESVGEPRSLEHDIGPYGLSGTLNFHLLSVILAVPEECSIFIAVHFF